MKNVVWRLIPGSSFFQESSVKKDSKEVSVLIWTDFERFPITYAI